MSWAAPDCMGYDGAVAMIAGSAPVGVPPAYPTSVGNSVGTAFVGEGGGKGWRTVEPT
jgi:hypothetical protein